MTAVFYSEDARRLHIKQPRYEQGWCGAELHGLPIEHRGDFRTPICADCLAILDAKRAELRAQLDAARARGEMLQLALAMTPNPNVKIDTASTASFRWPPHDDEEARP